MNGRELHRSAIVCDTHQEILDEYVYQFLLNEEQAVAGKRCIFDEVYRPILEKQGVNFVNMAVGGDHVAQVMYSASEHRFWDAHKKLDVINCELEAGATSFVLCKTVADIDKALSENKIGIFATIAGGRVLHGKANLNLLSSLRSLYRQGLRGLQLTGNSRNRLGDGVAQERSRGKLTSFGEQVVKEADRLGMVIDTAQLSDPGFYDLLELTKSPIIDSHSCSDAVHSHPRNISDKRIKAIAERGGVVGLSFRAALVDQLKDAPDVTDLLSHVDHISSLVGIEHLSLGPDYCAYKTPVDRAAVKGFGHLGPDHCDFDRKTPVQSEKVPGWVENIWYGIRESDFVTGLDEHEDFPGITGAMLDHGYSEAECRAVLGENLLRVYRNVLSRQE
jgi:membrane dipeptidase